MRVRTVVDLGTDALYVNTHDMLFVDADLTEREYNEVVRMASARYEAKVRHLHLV